MTDIRAALERAEEWIGRQPHGDNCFVADGEHNRCVCGKAEIRDVIDAALAAPPVQSEPAAWMADDGRTVNAQTKLDGMPTAARDAYHIPLYAAPQARDGWIPVSERLPDVGQLVVCRYAQGTVWAGQYHAGIKCIEWLALPALAQEKEPS